MLLNLKSCNTISFCMESRIRYSNTASVELVTFKPKPGLGNYKSNDVGPYPYNVPEFRELFEVYTPNSGTKRRNEWKNFQHYKCGSQPGSFGTLHPCVQFTEHGGYAGSWYHLAVHQDVTFGYRGFGPAYHPIQGLSLFYSPDPGNPDQFVQDPAGLQALLTNANAALMADVKQSMSLINSILELKDFKGLLSGAKLALMQMRNKGVLTYLQRWRRLVPVLLREASMRDVARWLGQKHLAVSFAWLPLVSDITALWRASRDAQHRLTRLLRIVEKPVHRHYRRAISESDYQKDEWYGYYALGPLPSQGSVPHYVSGIHSSYRTVITEPAMFCVSIEYTIEVSRWQAAHAQLLALLDVVGVNLSPSIIWNAIPFTFMVDWLLNINSMLEALDVGNMEPKIHIRNYCWSVSRARHIRLDCEVGANTFGYEYTPRRPIANVRETAYKRVCGYPSVTQLAVGGLSPREISLGASLLLARRKWRPKRNRR